MNNSPLISICIPVYNKENFIALTIQSVLQQTFDDLELIVLDNASTDQTAQRIQQFSDPRLRYLRHSTNIGMKANWNRCLEEARGQYVKILPADDLLYPTCLEKQLAAITQPNTPPIVMACCGRDIIDSKGNRLLTRRFYEASNIISGEEAIRKIIRSGTNRLGEPGAILFHRNAVQQAGHFHDRYPYVIDLDLWVRVLRLGQLAVLPETLCAFRISASSESVVTRRSQSRDFKAFIKYLQAEQYPITPWDARLGILRSSLLEIARRLVYRATSFLSHFSK
jgi:glycosyltransferase involved in cell wall biosynthesis